LRRIERSRQLQRLLGARGVGASASEHRHWIFPITHGQRNALISHLARHGFDAAVSASSLGVIGASAGRAPAIEATRIFDTLVYIPAHEGMTEQDIERLAIAVETFEQQPAPAAALKVP
jgi:dTDP-4-amino-4,6-dideoxygalactose transaminase